MEHDTLITYQAKTKGEAVRKGIKDGWNVYRCRVLVRAYPQVNRLGTYRLTVNKVHKKGKLKPYHT